MQKRNEYADGNAVERGAGYSIIVRKPWADGAAVAIEKSDEVWASIPYTPVVYAEASGSESYGWDYLITLEVKGKVLAYRELHTLNEYDGGGAAVIEFNDGTDTFTFNVGASDGGSFVVFETVASGATPLLTEGDEVRLVVEPVEIKLSPAFRAAVKKAYVAKEPEPVEGIEPIG